MYEKAMMQIPVNVPNNVLQRSVDLVVNEAHYLCCFKSYVENFEKKKDILAAKQQDVKIDIENASGVSRVKNEAHQWTHKADNLIEVDAKTKRKWFFGLCPNFCWQYRRGKELAEKTLEIEELLGRCSFNIVAGPADLPGIKYHSSPNFIHFESRKLKFQHLMEALEDENCNVIGLQGMGGTGKTSLAIEVGVKLGESKFHEVILLVVSNRPDFKKIRGEIARHLDLTLEEGKEEEHSKTIWSKITSKKEKLLIILDDVWEEFDLIKDMGIPSGHQHKACSVLIITRNSNVCEAMGCQRMIQLQMLTDKEALNLFLIHASVNNSSSRLKGVVPNIVKQCGGLPVAVVAVARTLRNRPLAVWREALKTLQNSESMFDVNENLTKVYKCLKLSYDNLKNEKARELFLICSLFPEDFEISVELLSRIGIGAGLFGEVDKYYIARSKVLAAIQELVDSCLLLNVEEEFVKMHDLVREVALWIANKDIQVIMDFKTTIKADLRYLFWSTNNFPNQIDGTKLEILLINVNGLEDLKVPYTFFAEMTRLKVLHLKCTHVYSQILDSSLLHSLQSLKDIQTLCLMNLKLGNISILENLQSLVTLELNDCSIIELPEEILELKKLRLLEIRECKIKMNNPFEVIERCSQLEELYFVENGDYINEDTVPQKVSPLTLQRYHISFLELTNEFEKYGSISRYFFADDLRRLISEATFKQLVGTAELLILGGYEGTRWKNLIPNIVPMEDRGMNDLIILHLYSWPDIQCLIDTRNHYSDVTAFSKLIELHLFEMDIEGLCCGSLPSGFLEQLEIMELKACPKLHSMLFNGKLNLSHLKVMELDDCAVLTSIFEPSTAQSLVQLEELTINNCHALKHIVTDESLGDEIVDDDGDNDQKGFGSLFPKLKTLRIARCDKLEMILPILFAGGLPPLEAISVSECEKLKYIFGKYRERDHVLHQNEQEIMLPSLKEMKLSGVPSFIDICREYCKPLSSSTQRTSSPVSRDNSKEKLLNPNTYAISWAHVCCFPHKSRAASEETKTNVVVSMERLPDHTIPQGLGASKKWFEIVDTTQCLSRQLSNFRNIKKMKLANFPNLVSLFTLSIGSMILWEELTIEKWDGLKHMITNEADDRNDKINYSSIFPKLEKLEIWECKELEFLFPSTLFGGLKNLKSLTIKNAPELKYIVGKYPHEDHLSNQNQNEELHFDLPALEVLCLGDVPKIISICAMNYYLPWPSLQIIVLENCNIKSFTDLMVCSDERQLKWKTTKELHASRDGVPPFHATQRPLIQPLNNIRAMKLVNCSNLTSLLTLPIASTILLEILIIEECHELKCIVADEGDAQALMNYNSILSKLKELHMSRCRAVEYLFPASVFRSPIHLKYVTIAHAPELKYVFGSHHEDNLSHENQNIETCVDFPALESLCLEVVPNLVSICPKNYYLRGLSLKSIVLDMSPQFIIKSFTNFMVDWHARQQDSTTTKAIEMRFQTLTDLAVYDSKIEEIFNLTYLIVEKNPKGLESLTSNLEYLTLQNLSELRNICEGPNYILSLSNLRKLKITACKKLKAVFSASILRSLPELWKLEISDCEELVHIFEEDYGENADDHLRHEPCFPKLYELHVKSCDMLTHLFSISVSGILPNLMFFSIKEASRLEHILIRRGEMKEMAMKDVLPELCSMHLEELPSLVGVCHGIDFQTLRISSEVYNCPKFSFYESTTTQLQAGLENLDSEVQAARKEKLSSHLNTDQFDMKEAKRRQDMETQQSTIGSPNFTRGIKEATKEIAEENLISEMPTMIVEVRAKEGSSTENSHPSPLTSTKKAPVPTSPILTVLPSEGITLTAAKIFEEEEEEEGDPFVPPTAMIVSEQTSETILPPSPVPSKASTNLERTLPRSPSKPTYGLPPTAKADSPGATDPIYDTKDAGLRPGDSTHGERVQDDVATTNQPTREAVDIVQVSSKSCALAIVPSEGRIVVPISPPTTLPEVIGDEAIEEASVVQNEYEANVESNGLMSYGRTKSSRGVLVSEAQERGASPSDEQLRDDTSGQGGQVNPSEDVGVDPSPSVGRERESSYSTDPPVKHDVTESDVVEVSLPQLPSPLLASVEMAPSFSRTTYALTVPGVEEIVDMMKLEGIEPFMLVEAFETNPQLRLSAEDRSTRMLCFSYRVLLDILNILATRTPFTITEADKRSLAENLKDASVLGFDKDWLESIKTKVFDCDLSEVHRTQKVLTVLSDELKTNEAALATIRDKEAEATRAVEVAQKELEAAQSHFKAAQQERTNVRARHTQLLEARQGILAQQDQCWERISAKDRHFGF